MAITDKKKGVWGLDQTFNKINQGSIWEYSGELALLTWGSNEMGQMGVNHSGNPAGGNYYSSPIQIPGTTWDGSKFRAYKDHSGCIKTDGTLWMWGRNDAGQLGQNSNSPVTHEGISSPVQIPGTTWSTITRSSTSSHSGCIKTDGTLWLWGGNGSGQLGQDNRTQRSSPVQVAGTTWSMASQNEDAAVAVKTDGTLWIWGANWGGQLGLNQNADAGTKISSPTQIPGTTWDNAFLNSQYGAMATKTDGTLWSWGYNAANGYGILGLNDLTWRSSPTQIPGTWATGADKFTLKWRTATAVKADGTLWTWGWQVYGSGNNNNSPNISSPVQIGSGSDWNKVAATHTTQFAEKTDGTLWGWGRGDRGQLDNDSNINYSSPVQINGNWPSFVDGNQNTVFGMGML